MEQLRAVRRVLWFTMGLNLVATAAKLIVGFWTGSLSLVADGFDSVFDSASNVIGLIGIGQAARPADREHPYGHRKAENIATLVIAMLLFLTSWELIKSAVERLRNPSLIQTRVNAWSFAALLVSIAVHGFVVWYELRAGRRLRSEILVADAQHTRADIFVSISVIIGLSAVRFGYPLVDPILALLIALVIAKIGVDVVRENIPTLMDRTALAADDLERVALSVPGVISSHKARSRGHGAAVYADIHVRVAPSMSTEQAHAIAHEVQYRLRERHPDVQDVTVHVEPANAQPQGQTSPDLAALLRRQADGLGIAVHDVWVTDVLGRFYVDLHLEAEGALALQQAHELASALEARARAVIPNLAQITTHIEPRGQSTTETVRNAPIASDEAGIVQSVQRVVAEVAGEGVLHDVQARRGEAGWNVTLHYTMPGDIALAQAHIKSMALERRLRERIPDLERVVIHTEPLE
jgi:cation diffusion facilitator family transporter